MIAALLLVASVSASPSPAEQFALAAGAVDGVRLACHMSGGSSSPGSVADAIRALTGNVSDATMALGTYAQTELMWLDTKQQMCRSVDALLRMLDR